MVLGRYILPASERDTMVARALGLQERGYGADDALALVYVEARRRTCVCACVRACVRESESENEYPTL